MSVRIFVAENAREGLARVRRELGEDAVVLSTRPHPKGVELLASPYGDLAEAVPNDAPDMATSSRILSELGRLRGMLQNQLAGFAWGATKRRDPARVAMMQTLFAAGFGSSLARTLAAAVEMISAGICVTNPSPTVSSAYRPSASLSPILC